MGLSFPQHVLKSFCLKAWITLELECSVICLSLGNGSREYQHDGGSRKSQAYWQNFFTQNAELHAFMTHHTYDISLCSFCFKSTQCHTAWFPTMLQLTVAKKIMTTVPWLSIHSCVCSSSPANKPGCPIWSLQDNISCRFWAFVVASFGLVIKQLTQASWWMSVCNSWPCCKYHCCCCMKPGRLHCDFFLPSSCFQQDSLSETFE